MINVKEITPRRSKGLPVVDHPKLGKSILISKEANHGRWSLFGGGNNSKKSGGKIVWQEKSRDAVIRELKEELGNDISIELLNDHGYIVTDKSGRLAQKGIKQRIFSLLIGGKASPDSNEIEGIGYYPLDDVHQEIRTKLEENMDEFAKVALQNLRKVLYNDFHDVKSLSVSQKATKDFDAILGNNRGLIGRLLNW